MPLHSKPSVSNELDGSFSVVLVISLSTEICECEKQKCYKTALKNVYFFQHYLEHVFNWCSISCSKCSNCSVSWVNEFFCLINVSNLIFNCESKRLTISSTAFRISRTFSSFAFRTVSTFCSTSWTKLISSTSLLFNCDTSSLTWAMCVSYTNSVDKNRIC